MELNEVEFRCGSAWLWSVMLRYGMALGVVWGGYAECSAKMKTEEKGRINCNGMAESHVKPKI